MEYIHIRNLEKFHPGYKDRELQWAKIYINMADGDPDTELIDNEIDWSRLIKIILLELRAKKPLPNLDSYWLKKGFNLDIRPMSLTIQMLHNFITIVSEEQKDCVLDKIRVDKKREDSVVFDFDILWSKYPNKDGKKEAYRHFKTSVLTDKDFQDIQVALENYLSSEKVKKGFIKNGSTWFNNWRDWIKDPQKKETKYQLSDPKCKLCQGTGFVYNQSTSKTEFCKCRIKSEEKR